MRGLRGRVALVTGAARYRGIGRAISLRLAEEGCAVAVLGAPRESRTLPVKEQQMGWTGVRSLQSEIESLGGSALALDCDITDETQVMTAVSAAVERFGHVDILVNNAGVASHDQVGPIVDLPSSVWDKMIDVNLNGMFLMSKAVAKGMCDRAEGGAIVNLSSTAGRQAMAFSGAYSASKFAVIGFTQQLALELAASRIRVNCICPGATPTDMTETFWAIAAERNGIEVKSMRDATASRIPLRRVGEATEQAAVVAFLASADASYITGQTVNVDGGLHLA